LTADWLLSPVDPDRVHAVGQLLSWHARAMVLAWALLVPLGVLAARYLKVMPGQDWPRERDNKAWWHVHRGFHHLALALMLAGLVLALSMGGGPPSATASAWVHRWLGIAALALAAVQALSGWLRGSKGGPTDPRGLRGDHYDMTARRLWFEAVHKRAGYLALLAASAAIVTGLWQANAPAWMWLALGLWWAALAVAATVLSALGFPRANTYRAIWGPGDEHPGNAR
jgi:hypothetical protein